MRWERTEHEMCFLYDPDQENICPGAGGRKLKMVCVWCPNFKKQKEKKTNNEMKKEGEENAGG